MGDGKRVVLPQDIGPRTKVAQFGGSGEDEGAEFTCDVQFGNLSSQLSDDDLK